MKKPVAIMSAAAGRVGGARSQYALRLALNTFQPRLLTGPEVMVAKPAAELDESGQLLNPQNLKALEFSIAEHHTDSLSSHAKNQAM